MKKKNPVYLFLSVLEGLLSGGYFYLAKRDEDPMSLLSGCMWLAMSFFHGLLGIQKEDGVIILTEEDEDD